MRHLKTEHAAAVARLRDILIEYGPEWIARQIAGELHYIADECMSESRADALHDTAALFEHTAQTTRINLGRH